MVCTHPRMLWWLTCARVCATSDTRSYRKATSRSQGRLRLDAKRHSKVFAESVEACFSPLAAGDVPGAFFPPTQPGASRASSSLVALATHAAVPTSADAASHTKAGAPVVTAFPVGGVSAAVTPAAAAPTIPRGSSPSPTAHGRSRVPAAASVSRLPARGLSRAGSRSRSVNDGGYVSGYASGYTSEDSTSRHPPYALTASARALRRRGSRGTRNASGRSRQSQRSGVSVSSEDGAAALALSVTPAAVPMPAATKRFIRSCLCQSLLFKHLSTEDLELVRTA